MSEPPIQIAMICTGNICRSPMAEVIFKQMIAEDSFLNDRILVSSAGTANWHVGRSMDPRARKALDEAGFIGEGTAGRFADASYLDQMDYVVAMTKEQVLDIRSRLTNPLTHVILLRNLVDPGSDLDLPDPYYGTENDFRKCLTMITAAGQRLTLEFRRRLGADSCGA